MIRSDVIKSKLFGGVGFRNPTDIDYAIVDDSNQASTSGLYFDDASGFVTIQNIKDCQSDKSISVVNFNTYLKNLKEQAIDDVIREVFSGRGRALFTYNLYPFEKEFSKTLEVGSGFVGFRIEPTFLSHLIAKLEWVELNFDSDVSFKLYLFNSNQKAAVSSMDVAASANESKVVNLSDWFVASSDTYKDGVYYIGYFEQDLYGAKPIQRDWHRSTLQVRNDLFFIQALRLGVNQTEIDITDYTYLTDTYGLNLGISIYEDFTQLVLTNDNLFYPAIQYGMALKVLGIIRNSIRSNMTQRLTRENLQDIDFEVFGNSALNIQGIEGKYTERLNTIKNILFYEPMMTIGTLY